MTQTDQQRFDAQIHGILGRLLPLVLFVVCSPIVFCGLAQIGPMIEASTTFYRYHSTAQTAVHQVKNTLLQAGDELLREQVTREFAVLPRMRSCLYGQIQQIYGTNRPFTTVLTEYDVEFSRVGWSEGRYARADNLLFIDPNDTTLVEIFLVNPEDTPDVTQGHYETTYQVTIDHMQPSFVACS